MTTQGKTSKRLRRTACGGLLALLAVVLLLVGSPQAQAQSLRLQQLESPTTVVEAGSYRLMASVGTPTLGAPLAVQRALYRLGDGGGETLAQSASVPSSFALEGNYPNPFNPTTTIPFAVPEAADVTLAVYDLLGRRVAVLVEGEMAAGRHEAVFEASHLSSGVYLVRLQSEGFSQVRRMTLVK